MTDQQEFYNEIDYLKSIEVDISSVPEISFILDAQHNKERSLWNIFCLLSNKYTLWDGRDYVKEIRSFLHTEFSTHPNTLYLNSVIKCKNIGLVFGAVKNVMTRIHYGSVWSVELDYCDPIVYNGNGVTATKRYLVENEYYFMRYPSSLSVHKVDIVQL